MQLVAVALSDGRGGSDLHAPSERVFPCVGWWRSSVLVAWTLIGEVSGVGLLVEDECTYPTMVFFFYENISSRGGGATIWYS